jgi:cytochrome c peroxidase
MRKNILQKRSVLFSLPFVLLPVVLVFTHCGRSGEGKMSELRTQALEVFSPLPADAFEEGMNRSEELIELGKMLFFEPRLSKSALISCATCHDFSLFGTDQSPVSIGHLWRKGAINAPTVLNAAFHRRQFWDGRAATVESQALMPILDEVEMASTEERVLEVLGSIPEYVERFKKAFPDQEQPLVYDNVGNAIGAFERLLVTPSRFDSFLKGDENALTEEEKEGLKVFMDVGCITCHDGVVLGGQIFAYFQTPAERASGEAHPGRFNATGRQADKHFFKVPSLLNVEHTYPYLHDGSVWSLTETVDIVSREMLSEELTPEQNVLILAFLRSLSGEIPAYALEKPILPGSTETTPLPAYD